MIVKSITPLRIGVIAVAGVGAAVAVLLIWTPAGKPSAAWEEAARDLPASMGKTIGTSDALGNEQPWNFPEHEERAGPAHAEWSPALDAIREAPAGMEQAERIRELVAGIPEADLAGAIAFFRQSRPADVCGDIASGLLRRLAAIDLAAAAASAEAMPVGEPRRRALDDVAIVWANADAATAADWVNGLADPAERESGLLAVANEAARTDPTSAVNLVLDLPPTAKRDALLDHAAAQWAASEPETAAEWAEQIPDSALRERVQARVFVEWADHDPAAAAAMAVARLPAGRAQEDTVVSIVQRWAQTDPEGARQWITRFPEGGLKETAAENLTQLQAK